LSDYGRAKGEQNAVGVVCFVSHFEKRVRKTLLLIVDTRAAENRQFALSRVADHKKSPASFVLPNFGCALTLLMQKLHTLAQGRLGATG
jgi:hypothetical protein